ncbi:hypothetical protein HRW07_25990 [Streptomyces lunaelactis]|uniref:hypothetical protein n=1 Tax=Streptomyces lunaelactis TaxID=1535768 RepID=UPI0015851EA8|nr:hypothetical protein [Streptomyces lunaelactis]NUL06620.1 hypothetical protein [Streptomyces lunaelactis]
MRSRHGLALLTGTGSPRLVGLGSAAVTAVLPAAPVCGLLGRATAHRDGGSLP